MGKQKKNANGITLIALVISIIVMLILAGVSLNMTIGDNGIIKQAQNASYEMGMSALEEWLHQEYIKYYDSVTESDKENEIAFLNRMFNYTLLLKDGSRDYIINEGKVYYLLNKSCSYIPNEIKAGLLGGDTTEYSEYTRLHDVYGITKDLKVYYCGNGIEGAIGTLKSYDIDPNASATGINGSSNLKSAISDILANQYGITVDEQNGVTLSDVSVLKNLELDGSKYPGITDISGLGDLKNLKTLILTNMNLTNLKGLDGIPNIYYLYFKNTTVGDYTALASCLNLQYLYMYLPNSIDQTTANNQIIYLGEGLKNASGLTKLQYFGISGSTVMFDDTLNLHVKNPATSFYYNTTNKLLLTDSGKSNVTSLGEKTSTTQTGLYAFNNTIKNNLQYVYLNNNSFSNISALANFNEIVELQLMCNSNLSNINGISGNKNLSILTMQNCALSSLCNYDSQNNKYYGGILGCTALTKLSIQNNSNLTSLVGIDDATNIMYLIAKNCNITNIDSLANHSNIEYLNLANNTNLVSVKYIQHCKALNYLYLDSNQNMSSIELDSALNGSDKTTNSLGTDALIKNCANGYANIPKKYWDLFTSTSPILDWSYATLGEYLTVDSAKWVKLKGRTDVTKLKLDGQTQLEMNDSTVNGITYYGIKSTLETLTGMNALSLKNCTQVNNISFVVPTYQNNTTTLKSGMPELAEINLCSISTTLTDYSALNSCTNMKALIIDNSNVNLTNLVTTLKRLGGISSDKSWTNGSYGRLTLCSYGPWVFHDESETNKLTTFKYNWTNPAYSEEVEVNLSDTSCTQMGGFARDSAKTTFILPSTISVLEADCSRKSVFDFSTISSGKHIANFSYGHNSDKCLKSTLATSQNIIIDYMQLWCFPQLTSDDINFGSVKYLNIIYEIADSTKMTWNLKSFANNTFTERISIGVNSLNKSCNLSNLTEFGKNRTIKDITFSNVNLSDISWISGMTQLKCLSLPDNNISNISALSNLESIDMKRTSNGVTTQSNFNLKDNNITDLTPLATAIGTDKVIGYKVLDVRNNSLDGYSLADNITALLKLHAAGLEKVYITGNNFSVNEVNELINGKTVTNADGTQTTYNGFGSSNVLN